MAKVRSWAGLDVHAAKVIAVTVDAESGELRATRLSGVTGEVVAFCAALPGPVRVAYEAGPTGFGLARALVEAGVGCVVAAPGKIEREPLAGRGRLRGIAVLFPVLWSVALPLPAGWRRPSRPALWGAAILLSWVAWWGLWRLLPWTAIEALTG